VKRPFPYLGLLVPVVALALGNAPTKDRHSAPTEDRVGYPKDYRNTFLKLRREYRAKKDRVVTSYANPSAASVVRTDQLPYPYGSIFVLETAEAAKDQDGHPLLDKDGQNLPGNVTGLHVMRREKGYGEAYRDNRTGEWSTLNTLPTAAISPLRKTPPPALPATSRQESNATGSIGAVSPRRNRRTTVDLVANSHGSIAPAIAGAGAKPPARKGRQPQVSTGPTRSAAEPWGNFGSNCENSAPRQPSARPIATTKLQLVDFVKLRPIIHFITF
jgi:hypothetical protein